MISIFKKQSPIEKLQKQFQKRMNEWHKLSQTNRAAADAKYAEAELIAAKIKQLKNV